MPAGEVHERANLLFGAGAALVGSALGLDWREPLWLGAALGYALGTFWVTPDLDNFPRYPVLAARRWGPLKLVWLPYGLLFRHRGLAHHWVLGPLSRLLYLSPLLLPLRGWLGGLEPALLWGALLGYYASQWLHLALDGIPLRRL